MTTRKETLKKRLAEARAMVEDNFSDRNFAKAFGYLEMAVENYLKGGEENEQSEQKYAAK